MPIVFVKIDYHLIFEDDTSRTIPYLDEINGQKALRILKAFDVRRITYNKILRWKEPEFKLIRINQLGENIIPWAHKNLLNDEERKHKKLQAVMLRFFSRNG